MTEGGYRDAGVYDGQFRVRKTFFENPPSDVTSLQKEHWPSSIPQDWTEPPYDITGFNGPSVVSLLTKIVNDEDKFKQGKTLYFLIRNGSGVKVLYRLQPKPTEKKPGNGFFAAAHNPEVQPVFHGKNYNELNFFFKQHYVTNTKSFAQDIKKLFENNIQNEDIPETTMEVYMLLLFEIARQLVNVKKPKKEALTDLPIGSAVARLIKLLELGKSTFDEVFLPKGEFHCFTGEPDDRRKAIEKINVASEEMAPVPEEELREMFCPEKQQAEGLTEELAKLFDEKSVNSGQEKTSQP